MKIARLLIPLCVTVLGISLFLKKEACEQNYVRLPVSFFPFVDRPTVQIEIEGKKHSVLLDLGSSHPIDLQKRFLQKVKNKQPDGLSDYVGIRGKKYPTERFRLPEVKLLNLTVQGLVGYEENLDFVSDARTWQSTGIWDQFKDQLELYTIHGRIGWTLFNETACFFDFPNSALYLAKDLVSLINEAGCSFDNFIQVPFEIHKWGIALHFETDFGINLFVLDTGATRSIFRRSSDSKEVVTRKLIAGDHDFGGMQFKLLDFTDQMECDGILGIDFFKAHAVCLDFHNRVALIQK
ncbi:MAG TPA: hypothetical protein VLF94_02235 [Chlamydiales bacterium]|nr:hypothetical protein [Chlamydiales bacterium]